MTEEEKPEGKRGAMIMKTSGEQQRCPKCDSSVFHRRIVPSLFFGQKSRELVCANGHRQ